MKAEAAVVVSDFIRAADTFQFDLLENPAISQLASDAKYGPLHKLLTTVIDGNVTVNLILPGPARDQMGNLQVPGIMYVDPQQTDICKVVGVSHYQLGGSGTEPRQQVALLGSSHSPLLLSVP